MTFTAAALQQILGNRSGADFARQCGIDPSAATRYLRGDSVIGADVLERVLAAIPKTQRSELLQAWLCDHLPPGLRTGFRIIGALDPVNAAKLPPLTKAAEETLRYWWRAAATDPNVPPLLHSLRQLRETPR